MPSGGSGCEAEAARHAGRRAPPPARRRRVRAGCARPSAAPPPRRRGYWPMARRAARRWGAAALSSSSPQKPLAVQPWWRRPQAAAMASAFGVVMPPGARHSGSTCASGTMLPQRSRSAARARRRGRAWSSTSAPCPARAAIADLARRRVAAEVPVAPGMAGEGMALRRAGAPEGRPAIVESVRSPRQVGSSARNRVARTPRRRRMAAICSASRLQPVSMVR